MKPQGAQTKHQHQTESSRTAFNNGQIFTQVVMQDQCKWSILPNLILE